MAIRHKQVGLIMSAAQMVLNLEGRQHSSGISPSVPVAMKLTEVMPALSYVLTAPCGPGLQTTTVMMPARSLGMIDPIATL